MEYIGVLGIYLKKHLKMMMQTSVGPGFYRSFAEMFPPPIENAL